MLAAALSHPARLKSLFDIDVNICRIAVGGRVVVEVFDVARQQQARSFELQNYGESRSSLAATRAQDVDVALGRRWYQTVEDVSRLPSTA